jgi:hypothetical protein
LQHRPVRAGRQWRSRALSLAKAISQGLHGCRAAQVKVETPVARLRA